ncbi:hypothetical protein Mapa_005110 [Marchantia paleacea]|nr:hypothetical protein Mapa_005110 [Marchantia paleacea]
MHYMQGTTDKCPYIAGSVHVLTAQLLILPPIRRTATLVRIGGTADNPRYGESDNPQI